jgi:hypothetical protein
MKSPRRPPHLQVVQNSPPDTTPEGAKSPFDDMAALRAQTEAAFAILGKPTTHVPSPRLARSTRLFARVYLDQLSDKSLFPPHTRLWLVLWCRSREGQQSVRLTARIAAEAGIASRRKARYARQLEQLGIVAIREQHQKVFIVDVLPFREPASSE